LWIKDDIRICVKSLFSADMLGLWELFEKGDHKFCLICPCTKMIKGVVWDENDKLMMGTVKNDKRQSFMEELQNVNPDLKPWRVVDEVCNKDFPIPNTAILVDLLLHGVVRVVGTFVKWDLRKCNGSKFTGAVKVSRNKRLNTFVDRVREKINPSFQLPLIKAQRLTKDDHKKTDVPFWSTKFKLVFDQPNFEGTEAWKFLMDEDLRDYILSALTSSNVAEIGRASCRERV